MFTIKADLPALYSPTQVQKYLEIIGFPADVASFIPNLGALDCLIRQHLLTFPFENTPLHYDADHDIDASPQPIYQRLVEQKKGGSLCYGLNGLLMGMLRGLGYRAIAVSGRVNLSPPTEKPRTFSVPSHLCILVQFGGGSPGNTQTTYLVDTAFGRSCLVHPLLLEVGQTASGAAPPEEHRIAQASDSDSSVLGVEWALEYRCGSDQPNWSTLYSFSETETPPSDWIAYSQNFCARPPPVFKNNVVCLRFFATDTAGPNGALLGRFMLMGNKVLKKIGTHAEPIMEFNTEKERIQILRDVFGIIIEETEIEYIENTPAAFQSLPVN
ncbi:cysteine proteinase [Hysterangium stoloniferum]|nr:cysteine proteinase [Hysterangium stoloniferum]